jgi:hypothetical protein
MLLPKLVVVIRLDFVFLQQHGSDYPSSNSSDWATVVVM